MSFAIAPNNFRKRCVNHMLNEWIHVKSQKQLGQGLATSRDSLNTTSIKLYAPDAGV